VSEQNIQVVCSGDGLGGAIVGVASNVRVSLKDQDGIELDSSKLKVLLMDPFGKAIAEHVCLFFIYLSFLTLFLGWLESNEFCSFP